MAARPYNVIAICAGVGGLELGVRIARPDARAVCYLEREIPAAARLAARMQDGSLHPAPIWSDLTTFDHKPWRGLVDCITSGDPCQPNSVAGKQRGKDDDRWLLDQIFAIVEGVRPARFFRENVPGNAHGQLAYIVPALEKLGYRVAAGIFSASEVGASHRRERLFIMADREDIGHERGGRAWDRRDGPSSEGPSMADNASQRRGKAWCGSQRPSQRPDLCGALGNPISGRDGRNQIDARRGSIERDAVERSGCAGVGQADTCSEGSQGRQLDGPLGQEREAAHGSIAELRGACLFAPGPNAPTWREIIRSSPMDAPAISDAHVAQAVIAEAIARVGIAGIASEAQSIIRRMDAWMAGRVDRLRAGGNGVSSLAASLAWSTLEATLAGDDC